MKKQTRVAVIYGGKSGEHQVSLLSAASVMEAIDPDRFSVIPIWITETGDWRFGEEALSALSSHLSEARRAQIVHQLPSISRNDLYHWLHANVTDVVFPVLHGTNGEDGTVQGFLEVLNLPYVGAGVLASAVALDKEFSKKLFAQAGLSQAAYEVLTKAELDQQTDQLLEQIELNLGYPCFVKPANLGSSVGISKANDRSELIEACRNALQYDQKIIVEEFIDGREVEVAVMGNERPEASMPGEIIPSNDFYDYHAKYVDGKSEMQIPAQLPGQVLADLRELAIKAYRSLSCTGLARADFFVRLDQQQILINEINTMPGFTQYSMYPKMWEESGLAYTDLITQLIDLALDRFQQKQSLVTTFLE